MADGQVVLVTTEPLGGGSRVRSHYAHSTGTADSSDWQLLHCHLQQVALRAATLGNKFGVAKAAALAGWLHDLGKYAEAYQAYIAGRGPGGVDHSTAGAQEVLKLASRRDDKLIAQLIAYAIAGHHGGLPDMSGATGDAGALADRLNKPIKSLDNAWRAAVRSQDRRLFREIEAERERADER